MSYPRVFGPVPSRRLGRSLGVNNIPPKICSYSCVYCQLGRSLEMIADQKAFYNPEELAEEVKEKLAWLRKNDTPVDYLTIVPDGEPTLDLNLGKLIDLLKTLGIKIAVISNASLIHQSTVREGLSKADWVSLKADTVEPEIWKKIDRPYGTITLKNILSGIKIFSGSYQGILVTETMLVDGLNDSAENLHQVANFLSDIDPFKAYISIPTRPPAEKWVSPPDESTVTKAYQIFLETGLKTELLIGYEGNQFAFTGDIEEDLLSITSVHPMREDAVREYLKKAGGNYANVEKMVAEGKLIITDYRQERFYCRKLKRNQSD